jgi:pimeloyl-ACP methyl ester carboxylesterase
MQRFKVHVSEQDLHELAQRLSRTRWPELEPGWERGVDPRFLRELVRYWHRDFDWPAQETWINRLPQYIADIGGTRLHFAKIDGQGPAPLPLLLTHGWPSSFLEFVDVVPLLTDPAAHGGDAADAFDVVIPSLPGFAFSPGAPGRGVILRAPHLWTELMTSVLGYKSFGAHGTDIGAFVTNRLALHEPTGLVGIHVTQIAEPHLGPGTPPLDEAERRWVEQRQIDHERGQAYAHLQRTKPTTLGYALNDSPVGLAAWLIEKWRAWSDSDGDPYRRFTADQLLTTIALYWFTGTATSSIHAYADLALATAAVPNARPLYPAAPPGADGIDLGAGRQITAPAGVLRTLSYDPPRSWAERAYSDLRHWRQAPAGGHFLALEEPGLLVTDLRDFFRPLRPETPVP